MNELNKFYSEFFKLIHSVKRSNSISKWKQIDLDNAFKWTHAAESLEKKLSFDQVTKTDYFKKLLSLSRSDCKLSESDLDELLVSKLRYFDLLCQVIN